jgi:hypothetical protein
MSKPNNTPNCSCVKIQVQKKKMDKQTKKNLIIAGSVIGSAAVITSIVLGLVYGLKDSDKKKIKDSVQGVIDQTKEKIQPTIDQATDKIQETKENVLEKVDDSLTGETKAKVQENKSVKFNVPPPKVELIKVDAFSPARFPTTNF